MCSYLNIFKYFLLYKTLAFVTDYITYIRKINMVYVYICIFAMINECSEFYAKHKIYNNIIFLSAGSSKI